MMDFGRDSLNYPIILANLASYTTFTRMIPRRLHSRVHDHPSVRLKAPHELIGWKGGEPLPLVRRCGDRSDR